ncbi:hypothetical protein BH23CHL5_BH23CHL5_05910 [soil metagenome]
MTADPPDSMQIEAQTGMYDVAIDTLQWGFRLSAALVATGLVWSVIAGEQIPDQIIPIRKIPSELLDGTPAAALMLGFLALIGTPMAVVLRLGTAYLQLGDRRFALVSFVVLGILVLSVSISLLR